MINNKKPFFLLEFHRRRMYFVAAEQRYTEQNRHIFRCGSWMLVAPYVLSLCQPIGYAIFKQPAPNQWSLPYCFR